MSLFSGNFGAWMESWISNSDEVMWVPLQTEFPVFWEFLGILKNSQLCKYKQLTV